jgi:hypothetical protein
LQQGFTSRSIWLLQIIPDFAVGVVARRLKPKRNAQLEQFFDEGISVDMVRKKNVKQALQQGFTSRSRWLLQILGLWVKSYIIRCISLRSTHTTYE